MVGEFSFTCSDPFKYSIEELEAVPGEDQGQTILIDYAGTVEAYPKLEVDFPKTGNDDVCSYLAFANDRGDVIQIGGVDTSEFVDGNALAKNLIYEYFYSDIDTRLCCGDDVFCSDSLPCCLSHEWQKNTGTFLAGDDTVIITGEAGVSETGSNGRLIAQSYGSGSSFHGPSVFAEVSNTSDGAVDFECAFRNYLEAGIDEKGMFAVTLNRSGEHESIIASLVLLKKEDREAVDILMIVNDVVRKRITVSLPLPAVSVRIAKEGSRVVFTVAGRTHTFIDDTLVSVGIHKIGFLFGAYSSETVLSENALEWVRLTDHPGDFTINDAVVADCRSASITMNDISRPALDVIGNDWETFVLKPGINQIRTSYKSSGSKPPAFKVRYREVFLCSFILPTGNSISSARLPRIFLKGSSSRKIKGNRKSRPEWQASRSSSRTLTVQGRLPRRLLRRETTFSGVTGRIMNVTPSLTQSRTRRARAFTCMLRMQGLISSTKWP